MHRRHFLRTTLSTLAAPSALAALGACGPGHIRLPSSATTAAPGGRRRLTRFGIQLYTLREMARNDLDRTFAAISSIGYRSVELLDSFDSNFGHPAEELRMLLAKHRLAAPSTHTTGTAITADLERTLDDAETIGHRYLIVAEFGTEAASTLDDYKRWADRLNEAGAVARRRDIWIGFHNHAKDFRAENGVVLYDAFIERTDPDVTRHELDTGNLADAGHDPLEYLRRYGERYWLFHLKDHAKPPAQGDGVLGTGTLDFRRILAAIPALDQKHCYVEQETYPGSPLDSAREDYRFLEGLTF
jgi:sugar phosphate isomerase/epimerase